MAQKRAAHWLDAERLRVYPLIVLAFCVVLVIAHLVSVGGRIDAGSPTPLGSDFMAFYSGSKLALLGRGLDAFDVAAFLAMQHQLFPAIVGPGYGWYYPPTFLLVIAPLALLPYLVALFCFLASSTAVWWATLRAAIGRSGAGWLIAAFPGLWMCLASGQNGLLTATLAAGSLLTLTRRPVLSGVLLGLLAIKPHLAVLFAVGLLAAQAWKTLLTAAATALAFVGLSVAVFGAGVLPAWLTSLQLARDGTEQGDLPLIKNPSTFAALRLLGTPMGVAYAAHALVAVAAVVAVWMVWHRTRTWTDAVAALQLRGAVLMAATFLVNPYVFDYDMAWLAFPIAWLALLGLSSGWRRGDRAVLVATWLLPVAGTMIAALTHLHPAPVVLGALVWIVVRRVLPARSVQRAPSGPASA